MGRIEGPWFPLYLYLFIYDILLLTLPNIHWLMIRHLFGVDSLKTRIAEVPDLATAAFFGGRWDEASLAWSTRLYSIGRVIKSRFTGLTKLFVRLQLRNNLVINFLKAALRSFERTLTFFWALATTEGEAGLANKDIVFGCGADFAAEKIIKRVASDEAGTISLYRHTK